MRRERGLTLFDGLLLVALLAIVGLVLLPGRRVDGVLAAEEAAIDFSRQLGSRIDAIRAAAARDLDGDGVGEAPPIAEVIEASDGATASSSGTAFRRDGYWYTVLVPGRDRMASQPSDEPRVATRAAVTYVIMAWPVEPGKSGMRAYLRSPHGGLLRHAIDGYPYGGPDRPPAPRVPLVETRGGETQPVLLASDRWVAPRETVSTDVTRERPGAE